MKKLLALIFLFAIRLTVFAGNPNGDVMLLNGNVVDKSTHESLAGVLVHVVGTDIKVYTDFDGNFFLPELPRGNYQIEFDYITYKSAQVVSDPQSIGCDYCSTLNVEIEQN